MELVVTASGAELLQLNTAGVVLLVLIGCVVAHLALGASHGDDNASACLRHAATPPIGTKVITLVYVTMRKSDCQHGPNALLSKKSPGAIARFRAPYLALATGIEPATP